jgi:hypothetical protein
MVATDSNENDERVTSPENAPEPPRVEPRNHGHGHSHSSASSVRISKFIHISSTGLENTHFLLKQSKKAALNNFGTCFESVLTHAHVF